MAATRKVLRFAFWKNGCSSSFSAVGLRGLTNRLEVGEREEVESERTASSDPSASSSRPSPPSPCCT